MSDVTLPFSPAAERNREPILEVLTRVLPASCRVLEIASGNLVADGGERGGRV